MIRPTLVPIVILASSVAAIAATAEADPADKQLQVYPKNIARHHIGANIFLFNTTSQSYTPTEAAAAWLDDDINTGFAPVAGKQHYMLALPEPEVITNFALSSQGSKGTVNIYAGDEPSAPGAKSWQPVARDVSLQSIDGKKLAKPFNRLAKYILLETDVTEAAPIHSLYLYGERPAVSFQLVKRDQPIDTRAIFGPYTNNLTAISTSGLYAGGRVAFSTEPGSYTAWQKAIDDNPESGVGLITSGEQAAMVLKFNDSQPVTRLSVLAGNTSKGKLEVFVVPSLPDSAVAAAPTEEGVQPVASKAKASPVAAPVMLTGLTPSTTFNFDGTTVRHSQDLTGAQGTALLFRWTPEFAGESLVIRELNAFGNFTLSDYALALSPEAIAELAKDASKDGKAFVDGKGCKALAPVGEGPLEPVGELFPRQTPYLPPALGFPPPIPPTVTLTSP
jgi:hypothetical protein